MSRRRVALGLGWVVCLALALPARGWSWGSDGHHYIARNYSQHLPPEIDGLRAWDATVDSRVMDPDYRKSSDPSEGYRHYMDIDAYPEFFAGTMPHDRAVLEARYGASTVQARGVLPWAVGEVVATMTQQFQSAQWSALAISIADLCHYVGDGHQPLHCTQNYDGQYTGNSGIHARYETTMLSMVIGDLHTDPMAVELYPNAVDAMFDIIGDSWSGKDQVLQADNTAKAASGGSFNTIYYQTLWHEIEALTRQRIDEATRATASFVYTAWQNAGRPAVPGSTVDAVPLADRAFLSVGPTPFDEALAVRFSGTGPLTVEVFDVRGSRVATLASAVRGISGLSWRPGEGASRTGPGIYWIRLRGDRFELSRRAVYLP